ncbi:MAG: hypothetical protein IJB85_03795 [Clostridia bacterium]|nr:hypothetical protein [Clostridia bacterium]
MMKIKRLLVIAAAVLLVVILPVSAMALTTADSWGTSRADSYVPYSTASARDYQIKFGKEHHVGNNDTYPVYSAPALDAVRGGNGKASLHTSGGMYSAGWEGAWLLVRYEKNNGGYRVGWVPRSELNMRGIEASRSVDFAYWTVTLAETCYLTDDPLYESEVLAKASAGEQLTYLACYQYGSGKEYAYVRGELNGRPICGFIPFSAIDW